MSKIDRGITTPPGIKLGPNSKRVVTDALKAGYRPVDLERGLFAEVTNRPHEPHHAVAAFTARLRRTIRRKGTK